MDTDKVIVRLYVPRVEEEYDVFLPLNKQIYVIISLLVKAVNEFTGGYYKPKTMPLLYDKFTAKLYDVNLTIKESTIRNGSEIVMI